MYEQPKPNPDYKGGDGIDGIYVCPKCGGNLTTTYVGGCLTHDFPTWLSCFHGCDLHYKVVKTSPLTVELWQEGTQQTRLETPLDAAIEHDRKLAEELKQRGYI